MAQLCSAIAHVSRRLAQVNLDSICKKIILIKQWFNLAATSGSCPVNCKEKLIMFLIFLCLNKFIGGSEGAANFLLGVRCVDKKDKAIAFGLSSAILSLLGVAPSATFFGYLIDKTCILWGKSCSKSGTGNCWLYNTDIMKYSFNFTSGGLILIGTLFDIGTWYYSKDVEIFDKDEDEQEDARDVRRKSILALKWK